MLKSRKLRIETGAQFITDIIGWTEKCLGNLVLKIQNEEENKDRGDIVSWNHTQNLSEVIYQ